MSASSIRARALASLLLAACADPTADGPARHRVQLAFSLAPSAALFPGPFVSILDSVAVVVTDANGATTSLGAHLLRRDTSATMTVVLPDGQAAFAASVLSATRQVLFAGAQTATIARDGFVVRVVPPPITPVLVAAPDTVHVTVFPGSGAGQGTVTVHNRGVGTLVARFRGPAPQPQNGCAPLACYVLNGQVFADSALVPTKAAVPVLVMTPIRTVFPLTMTFASPQGSVPVVLVTP